MNFGAGDQWQLGDMPEHIRKRHPQVPSIDNLDDAVLPAAVFKYTEVEIIEPDRKLAPVLDNSSKLDSITSMALDRLEEVLEDGFSGDPKADAIVMDAVRLTLTTQLRVDDSRLKKRQTDTLAELLRRMDEEDGKLKQIA